MATGLLDVTPTAAQQLPDSFVFLRDVDDTIAQDIRYAGSYNFMGRPSKGYEGAECVLAEKVANALKSVQARFQEQNLSLKVYDCYRPARAVNEFKAWSRAQGDEAMREEFYPTYKKSELFSLGFIASRSVHSTGCAVDLTLMPKAGVSQVPADDSLAPGSCAGEYGSRFNDGSLDMGTNYDCFSELSHTAHKDVGPDAQRNRSQLVSEMTRAGFSNYRREWWHFEFQGACPNKSHDFIVPQRVATSESQPLGEAKANSCNGTTAQAVGVLPKCLKGRSAPVHEERDPGSLAIAKIDENARGIECLECTGGTLADTTRVPPPWCLVELYAGGALRIQGWVLGNYIRTLDGSDDCYN